MSEITAINVEKINRLQLDIENYYERINQILDNINDIVDKISNNYQSVAANKLLASMTSFKDNFIVMNRNVLSYSKDFENLKSFYKNRDELFSGEIREINKKEKI